MILSLAALTRCVAIVVVLGLVASSSSAFTPVALPTQHQVATMRPSPSALHLELPVDPVVLAAGGIAVVGGLGTVLISQKLRDMDKEEAGASAGGGGGAGAATTTAPAVSSSDDTTIDLSIPYDAAARLAYEAGGSKGDYEAFKAKYEADAVAEVKAKQAA